MKSSIAFLALAVSSVSAFAPSQSSKSATELSLTREEILATPNTLELGEIYDPLGLSELGGDETIAWFRHAEVKHGRVAMAAFVGWCATAGAGLRFPGELAHGLEFSAVPSKGLEAWDAVPGWGKAQMLLFAGLIEFHDELFYARRGTHYMKGGVPGKVSTRLVSTQYEHQAFCCSSYSEFIISPITHNFCLAHFPIVEHGSRTLRSFQLVQGQV